MERNAAAKGSRARPLPICWAHLAVLWSFAFAKPLFDILADSPEFFVARENTAGDIIVLALAVTLVPPTVLALVELVFARAPYPRRLVHLLFVGLLTAAIAIQLLKDVTGSPSVLLVPLALALGAGGALAYERGRAVRTTLSVLTPLPLVFVILFLLLSPVSELVLPGGGDSSEARAGSVKPVPIVMVVFDELSGGSLMDSDRRIDATRYPSFAGLARDATWYRNTTTVADSTSTAVPAILTGKRPVPEALPTSSDHPDNLFTFLGDRYELRVQEPITDLCPPELCPDELRAAAGRRLRDLVSDLSIVLLHRLLPDQLREDLPAVDQAFGDFTAPGPGGTEPAGRRDPARLDHRPETFARFVRATGGRSRRPTLDFAHVELPHVPWEYLPAGEEYGTSDYGLPGTTDEVWTDDRRLVEQGQQRYLLQLAFADRLLGRLLDRLRTTGLYERALLIVTADHGVAFRPAAHRREISSSTFADIAGVPLFVKAPGQRQGRIDDSPARTVDILPTIADQLGSDLPWPSAGRPLPGSERRSPRSMPVFAGLGPPVTIPFAEFIRRRDQTVDRDTRIFGSADYGKGIFAPGGDSRLMGVPADALPRDPPLDARVSLGDPMAFRSIPRSAAVLPVFVTGSVFSRDGSPRRIAVAVNGRIAAVAEAFGAGGARKFEAIVDPRALRAGANEIRVFGVRGEGGARRLVPLGRGDSETYRLAKRGQREVIVGSSGGLTRVVPEVTAGFLDQAERDGAALRVSGWSASRELGAADRVLIFAGGRFIAAGTTSQPRSDVAQDLGPSGLNSGFSIGTYLAGGDRREAMLELRGFGIIDGRAYELENAGGD